MKTLKWIALAGIMTLATFLMVACSNQTFLEALNEDTFSSNWEIVEVTVDEAGRTTEWYETPSSTMTVTVEYTVTGEFDGVYVDYYKGETVPEHLEMVIDVMEDYYDIECSIIY